MESINEFSIDQYHLENVLLCLLGYAMYPLGSRFVYPSTSRAH
jgi:hypothetical protein